MHPVAPLAGWCVCAGHCEQAGYEPFAANVPGEQGTGSVAPTPQEVPGGQPWQPSAEASPVSLPKRPCLQGRAAGDPSGQYPPASHSLGVTVAMVPHT